jgi:hypothetical protein
MAYLYRHIRLDTNEVFYVGIGTFKKRCFEKGKRNSFWKNVVAKTPYRVDIIFDDIDREFALQKKIEFISIYGRRDLGKGTLVNLTNGGDEGGGQENKGRKASEETRRKLREAKKNHPPLSEEARKRISEANKGRVVSEETRKKLSILNMGKSKGKWSEVQRVKNKNFWKAKIDKIAQYDLDMNLIKIWDNRIVASEELSIKKDYIRDCIRNRKLSVNGFIFKRVEPAEPEVQL